MEYYSTNRSELIKALWVLADNPACAYNEVWRRMERGATLEQARAEVVGLFERTDCPWPADVPGTPVDRRKTRAAAKRQKMARKKQRASRR